MAPSYRPLVYAIVLAHAVSAVNLPWGSSLRKRDAPFVPARVDIPLSFDSSGRYIAAVTMAPGSGQQQFNFTMSTTSGLTYVAAKQCTNCQGANLYDQSQSTSAKAYSSANSVPFFGQDSAASVIKENCQLRTANGSQWPYPNQTIVVVNNAASGQIAESSNAQVGNGLSGLIGLGTNRNTPSPGNSSVYTPNFRDSIAGQWLAMHPTATNFTFGMAIGKPFNVPRGNISGSTSNTQSSDAGFLNWLQTDTTHFDASKVTWKDVDNSVSGQLPVSSNSTSGGDWFISLDGWVMVSGNNHLSNTKSVVSTVDPLYSDMYLPQDQAKLIHDAIPGSNLRPDLSSIGPLTQAWTIPCNSTFSFGLLVGSDTFTLNENDLVLHQPNGTCVSGIEGWTDSTQTQYLFGARFLSTIYLIFNVPQDGSNSIGFAPRASPSSKSNHVGAIVGGTIGGVAFVVMAGFALFFFVYRHRQHTYRITAAQYDAGQEIEKPSDGAVQPFPLVTPTSIHFASGPDSIVGSSSASMRSPTSQPMLHDLHDDEQILDVAPPSYEASEGTRSPTHSAHQLRPEKGSRRPASNASSSYQQPAIPMTPISPLAEASNAATGSATVWEE